MRSAPWRGPRRYAGRAPRRSGRDRGERSRRVARGGPPRSRLRFPGISVSSLISGIELGTRGVAIAIDDKPRIGLDDQRCIQQPPIAAVRPRRCRYPRRCGETCRARRAQAGRAAAGRPVRRDRRSRRKPSAPVSLSNVTGSGSSGASSGAVIAGRRSRVSRASSYGSPNDSGGPGPAGREREPRVAALTGTRRPRPCRTGFTTGSPQ